MVGNSYHVSLEFIKSFFLLFSEQAPNHQNYQLVTNKADSNG